MALFPNNLDRLDIFIADAEDEQVFACVMHSNHVSHLYVSDREGVRFSLSLENILYLSPLGAGKNFMESKEALVDIHKVDGVRGVYVATQQKDVNSKKESGDRGLDDLISVVTFNNGGDWMPLRQPDVDFEGKPVNCKLSDGCSLHVTQKFNQVYARSSTSPILSRESAIGLIVASGVIGTSLKGHPSMFVSSDAALTWHQVRYGSYLYAIGDHGGIIVAVDYMKGAGETDHVLYSLDEGEHWTSLKFLKDGESKIRVYNLMTEPGEKTTIFTLFGSRPNKHQWILVKLDLHDVFLRDCSTNDYKQWSPHQPNTSCLLGRREVFERRLAHSPCYSGEDYVRPVVIENCPCDREDYECDLGFKEQPGSGKVCVHDTSSNVNLYAIPASCQDGGFYNRSIGYRKVSGDTCEGGDSDLYNPETISCPVKEEDQFLLFAQRQQVSRISLVGERKDWERLPISGLKNVIAVDYDYHTKCLYWADIDDDKIMRQCLNGQSEPEVLVETGLQSVEGLALDWISKNLYFLDGESAKVEVIQVDLKYYGRMRRCILNNTYVGKPRGIAVHPVKGYLFLTDWSPVKPFVARANLDGSNFKILYDGTVVSWPNGITIDFREERIYWADAKRDYIASSDFQGVNLKYVLRGSYVVPHPFAVGVYKDWIYFDDWNRRQIVMANKYDGSGLKIIARNIVGAMDLKVFSYGAQSGTNLCSNRTRASCSHLCVGLPFNGHTCLCPDGMQVQKLQDGSEKCLCPQGELEHENGTCSTSSQTCTPYQFECSRHLCIPELWKCDGDDDCGDNSDEMDCGHYQCEANQFQCNNGKCIPQTWKCDIDQDCKDGSDEAHCKYVPCDADMFTCANGRCINPKYKCDFDDDCRDGSDEVNCTTPHSSCHPDEFSCLTGSQCLPKMWHCDGERDCNDGSDEQDCTRNTCQAWQFACKNGRCIFNTWKCDGEDDCHDNSDEDDCANSTVPAEQTTSHPSSRDCSPLMFKCNNSNCISFWWHCDGVNDCGDNSDEKFCSAVTSTESPTTTLTPKTCGEDKFLCNSGKCIWNAWVCDGAIDCNDGDDEKDCAGGGTCGPGHYRCVHSSGCIPDSDVCNGKHDCGDGSDEWGCRTQSVPNAFTCSSIEYTCKSGECISLVATCNQHWDCVDGSDEDDCTNNTKMYYVRGLEIDPKSINSTSFNVSWVSPAVNQQLEFMVTYADVDDKLWKNGTWSSTAWSYVRNLIPGAQYNVSVYVHNRRLNRTYPLFVFQEATTLAIAPNPPYNVTLEQKPEEKNVIVRWRPPFPVTGKITKYTVFFSPPLPPISWIVPNSSATECILHYDGFVPGVNYSFWITAASGEMESLNSDVTKLEFAQDRVLDQIKDLHPGVVTNTTAELIWEGPKQEIDGYKVKYRVEYSGENYPWETIATVNKSITLTNLAPGTSHSVVVVAYKKFVSGPDVGITFQTLGLQLPEVSDIKYKVFGSNITLNWKPVVDPRSNNWTYCVLLHTVDSLEAPPKEAGRTTQTEMEIRDLDSCIMVILEVRLCGPYGLGPSNEVKYIHTDFDKHSPPKNVSVAENKTNPSLATVHWNAACPIIDKEVGYQVLMYDKRLRHNSTYNIAPTKALSLSKEVNVHLGAEYNVWVRTTEEGSRLSKPYTFKATPLPTVRQVVPILELNGSLRIEWQEPTNLPKEFRNHSFAYRVWLSKDEQMRGAVVYDANQSPFIVDKIREGLTYYVAVSVMEQHGYMSEISDIVTVAYPSRSVPVPVASVGYQTPTVVGIVVAIVLVVVGLVAALAFFVTRHRRLQRSFLSFANSHYDTRSGSATFSTGDELEEEEDSPMIRGFSDDEPLVIA